MLRMIQIRVDAERIFSPALSEKRGSLIGCNLLHASTSYGTTSKEDVHKEVHTRP